jgi:hypothetical protein
MVNVAIENECPRCGKIVKESKTLDQVNAEIEARTQRQEAKKELESLLRSTLFEAHPDIIFAQRNRSTGQYTITTFDIQDLCFSQDATKYKGCRPLVEKLFDNLSTKKVKENG